MDKTSSYDDPSEYPIPVSAVDPLDGDLLFGLEDKPDEIRHKEKYVQSPEGKNLPQKEAATKNQVERLAVKLEGRVTQNYGPRFRRYVARLKAAMQLGMSYKELAETFYGGKTVVDPFTIAQAGYAAEGRFAHDGVQSLTQAPSGTTPIEVTEIQPIANPGEPQAESTTSVVDVDNAALEAMESVDGIFDMSIPSGPATSNPVEFGSQLHAASIGWLDGLVKESENMVGLQPDDEVTDDEGKDGKVTKIEDDGSVTVEQNDPYGTKSVTYKPDSIEQGEVKRKEVIPNSYAIRTHFASEAPATKKPKVLPRAPAGMSTEDGVLKEKEDKHEDKPTLVRVAFPNLEMREWSRRPPFVYGWYKNIKRAVIRHGGDMLLDDSQLKLLTAVFRNLGVAKDFAQKLVKEFNLQPREIQATVLKKRADVASADPAQAPQASDLWQKAEQHAEANPQSDIAQWLVQAKSWMSPMTTLTGSSPGEVLAQNPSEMNHLAKLVLQAEQQQRTQDNSDIKPTDGATGKAPIHFDPKDYINPAAEQGHGQGPGGKTGRLYRSKTAASLSVGDRVMVSGDDGQEQGQVVSVVGDQASVLLDSGKSQQLPVENLQKVSYRWTPLIHLPVEHRLGMLCRVTEGSKYSGNVMQMNTMAGQVKLGGQGQAPRWFSVEDLVAHVGVLQMFAADDKKKTEKPRMVTQVVPCECHNKTQCPFERQTYKQVPLDQAK